MTLPLIALLDCTPIPNYKDLSRLDGRAFVVLGGGNGIGRQTCHALAQSGARLFCVDRNEAFATAVASETAGRAIVADVTRRADVERIFLDRGGRGGSRARLRRYRGDASSWSTF